MPGQQINRVSAAALSAISTTASISAIFLPLHKRKLHDHKGAENDT